MFRSLSQLGRHLIKNQQNGRVTQQTIKMTALLGSRSMSSHSTETPEEFDARFLNYFNRKDIDGWELRKGISDLVAMDLVPEPKVIIAALKACRKVNDYALAIRFLEAVKDCCGPKAKEIYPYIVEQITPTLKELGMETPEALGYGEPELAIRDIYKYQ